MVNHFNYVHRGLTPSFIRKQTLCVTTEQTEAYKKAKRTKKAQSAHKPGVEEDSNTETPVWSISAPLVHTPGTKHILLKKQPTVIQDVLYGAIRKVTENVFFHKTWPEEDSRTRYGKVVLLEASRGAQDVKNYTGYVNFFKNFRLTPPKNGQIHPKKGTVSSKMEFFPLPHAVGFTD